MGITHVDVEVANPSTPDETESVQFLVDSGAVHSVVPAVTLDRLGTKPLASQEFRLAHGDKVVRRKGGAMFRYGERVGVSDVVFGEAGDVNLLGALTLEALGLSLDPLKRELRELPMLL